MTLSTRTQRRRRFISSALLLAPAAAAIVLAPLASADSTGDQTPGGSGVVTPVMAPDVYTPGSAPAATTPSGGGIGSLVAVGAQDVYLTNPR